MTVSPLLQILAIYVATSLAAGLTLGVALGAMIHRAERHHRQHVAQLMHFRTLQTRRLGGRADRAGAAASRAMLTATMDEVNETCNRHPDSAAPRM